MNLLSHLARRVLPLSLLILLSALALGAAEGYLSLPFLGEDSLLAPPSSPVGSDQPDTGESAAGNSQPSDDVQPPSDDAQPPSGFQPLSDFRPDSLRGAMTRADVLALCEPYTFAPYGVMQLYESGLRRSAEDFTRDAFTLALAGGFDWLPTEYSTRTGTKTVISYVRPDERSAPEPIYERVPIDQPSVTLYMGLILTESGSITHVYSSDGVFITDYDRTLFTPAYTRDKSGNPLFTSTVAEEDGSSRLGYFTPREEGMVEVAYDDSIDGRGLYFDYSPSYGISDNTLIRLANRTVTVEGDKRDTATVWAFGYQNGRAMTSYRYSAAYDYSEEMAAVLNEAGQMNFLTRWGYQAYITTRNYYYYDWYVTEYLLPPLTNGPESIGYYYYDHGLVRARRQVVDWHAITYWNLLRVAVDEDILLDKSGNEFPIPAGYTIRAYSDGVILLEKDGLYGYMDYTGQWIAQPIYDYAEPFSEGLGVLGFGDDVRLMVDTAGEVVIPAGVYRHISSVSSGVIAVCTPDGQWSVLHKMAQ